VETGVETGGTKVEPQWKLGWNQTGNWSKKGGNSSEDRWKLEWKQAEPRWNHSGNLGGTKLETGAKKRKLE